MAGLVEQAAIRVAIMRGKKRRQPTGAMVGFRSIGMIVIVIVVLVPATVYMRLRPMHHAMHQA